MRRIRREKGKGCVYAFPFWLLLSFVFVVCLFVLKKKNKVKQETEQDCFYKNVCCTMIFSTSGSNSLDDFHRIVHVLTCCVLSMKIHLRIGIGIISDLHVRIQNRYQANAVPYQCL